MRPIRPLLLVLALLASLLPLSAAQAAPFPVTNTKDDEVIGSLRASIEEANKNSGADTIPINVTGTIELGSALPAIDEDVAITGPGADELTVERASTDPFRIFDIGFGATSVSISGLTVRNGLVTGTSAAGAGIRSSSGSLVLTGVVVTTNEAVAAAGGGVAASASGGGVSSFGSLTLREAVVSGNVIHASGGSTSSSARGAGVAASGTLVIDRSTISGNRATAETAGTAASVGGAGVDAAGESTTIERSTISGNTATASDGGTSTSATGGGIMVNEQLSLTSSTLIGNSVSAAGPLFITLDGANLGFFSEAGLLVRNTIVADPVGAENCSEAAASGGFNLDEDSSCDFGLATDLAAVDPQLGPLAANGGPTPTHALPAGSAALDRGNSFGGGIDQRGLPRPSDFATVSNSEGGDGSDIGAFELQVLPNPILVTSAPADSQPPNTRIVSGPPRVTFKRLAKFRFASTEAQSSFQCKLDKKKWRGCRNPFKRNVGAGRKHLFKVRAIDRFGNVDRTPAQFGWRVKRAHGRGAPGR